jgi:hypothetical protein
MRESKASGAVMRKQIFVIVAILLSTLIEGFTSRGPRQLYLSWDPHFTPLGHQVTAELLYDATRDRLR